MPIRWRLAGGSAALTLVILASFAGIVGTLTGGQVRAQFNQQQTASFNGLVKALNHKLSYFPRSPSLDCGSAHIGAISNIEQAQIRIFNSDDGELLCYQYQVLSKKRHPAQLQAKVFGSMPSQTHGTFVSNRYRVSIRQLYVNSKQTPAPKVTLLYALPLSDVNHTVGRVHVFLLVGVIGGAVLALLAGLFVSGRAIRPIVELTDAARRIERTRDPRLRLPRPEADDEIAELARTLENMLGALDAARSDTQGMLDRQREFVADASHELRTPLTSVLANLELLTEELSGEQADTAEAALRSTRRMRRLVGDLLLLARADARRTLSRRPTDLAEVLVEAAAELGPMAEHHELSISAGPAIVDGVRDDLHRLVLNLLENAVRHTPPGTVVRASTDTHGDEAVLTVADSGPGIPADLRERVFERFVRGGRDRGRGSGLGLAIVRSVAESHGGTVQLARTAGSSGARFEIRIPAAAAPVPATGPTTRADPPTPTDPGASPRVQTSTTTGRTIGRRRNRS